MMNPIEVTMPNAQPGVRTMCLYVGTHDACVEWHDSRTFRSTDLPAIATNLTDHPGTHMVIVHQPPSKLRDAEDILKKCADLEPFEPEKLLKQLVEITTAARQYFRED